MEMSAQPKWIRLFYLFLRETYLASQAAHVGAKGFVPKDKVVRSLLLAIETVHVGKQFFLE
jgi:hypothetical protein